MASSVRGWTALVPAAGYEAERRSGCRLGQAIPLLHLRVGRVDRAHALLAEALVHLVEVVADYLLLGLRDAPTVRLAGVLEGGVVGLAPTRRLSFAPWAPPSPP
jgi:hypothetical protein